MENNISNPRMHNVDGTYAAEARTEDFFSLRDHFAGLAMQAMLSNNSMYDYIKDVVIKNLSVESYLVADAMLLQRSVSQNGS